MRERERERERGTITDLPLIKPTIHCHTMLVVCDTQLEERGGVREKRVCVCVCDFFLSKWQRKLKKEKDLDEVQWTCTFTRLV